MDDGPGGTDRQSLLLRAFWWRCTVCRNWKYLGFWLRLNICTTISGWDLLAILTSNECKLHFSNFKSLIHKIKAPNLIWTKYAGLNHFENQPRYSSSISAPLPTLIVLLFLFFNNSHFLHFQLSIFLQRKQHSHSFQTKTLGDSFIAPQPWKKPVLQRENMSLQLTPEP